MIIHSFFYLLLQSVLKSLLSYISTATLGSFWSIYMTDVSPSPRFQSAGDLGLKWVSCGAIGHLGGHLSFYFLLENLVCDAAVPTSGHMRATAGKQELATGGHNHWDQHPALASVVSGARSFLQGTEGQQGWGLDGDA